MARKRALFRASGARAPRTLRRLRDRTASLATRPEELVLTPLRPGTPDDRRWRRRSLALARCYAFEAATTLTGPHSASEGTSHIRRPLTQRTLIPASQRSRAGGLRDHILGVHAVSGRAEAFKAGGKVVKNVTGYDLARALTGSWGTLAVATEVTVKVLPRPQTETTITVGGLDPEAGVAALSRALGSPADVSGAAHLPADVAPAVVDGAEGPVTLVRVEGFGPSVAGCAPRLSCSRLLSRMRGRREALSVDCLPRGHWRLDPRRVNRSRASRLRRLALLRSARRAGSHEVRRGWHRPGMSAQFSNWAAWPRGGIEGAGVDAVPTGDSRFASVIPLRRWANAAQLAHADTLSSAPLTLRAANPTFPGGRSGRSGATSTGAAEGGVRPRKPFYQSPAGLNGALRRRESKPVLFAPTRGAMSPRFTFHDHVCRFGSEQW